MVDSKLPHSMIDQSPWFVMLTAPQQDLTTVWRMHELGLELFVPVERRRVKTGRVGKNGHKVTRVIPRPMFPGYGFLRKVGVTNVPEILAIRGVRDFMRDERGDFVELPHDAVVAVFRRQIEEQQRWMQANGGRKASAWKSGDMVRIDDDGGVYAGMLAEIDKVDARDRIHVFLGAAKIRHTLPAEMVVAA